MYYHYNIRFSDNEQSGCEDDSTSELLQLAHHEDTNVKESTGSVGPTKDVQEPSQPG